ncbi:MAG: hypothetical protein LUQ65_02905 [Candidatus Helarchaeota archaeon]|nr:hypothetical protein [Candidatus Helarchaeota archaeon]
MDEMLWVWIVAAIAVSLVGLLFYGVGYLFYKESPNILIRLRSSKETRELGILLMVFGVMIWVGIVMAFLFSSFVVNIVLLLFSSFCWLLGFFVLVHPGAISYRDECGHKTNWGRGTGLFLILVALLFFSFALVVKL